MKRILFLINHDYTVYNTRLEIVERLLSEGYEVHISSPDGVRIPELVSLGCKYHEISINRHGTNPVEDFKLIRTYKKLFKEVKPSAILSFTIKPNIYGAIAAKKFNIPFIANITGLGTAVENPGILQKISIALYRIAFSNIQTVFFQNTENQQFFIDQKLALGKHKLLPGSGVNLERYPLLPYPSDEKIGFVFISRIMKEKGIDEYLAAAEYITNKYPQTEFHICGFCEDAYEAKLEDLQSRGIIEYHGMITDIKKVLEKVHCTVHPSYYPEGLSNVLLESSASGRPVITTNRSGCREVVDAGRNGYIVEEKNPEQLISTIETFIKLPHEEKVKMGLHGRQKVEREFNREVVVEAYIEEIKKV